MEREKLKRLLLGLYFGRGADEETVALVHDLACALGLTARDWSKARVPRDRLNRALCVLSDLQALLEEGERTGSRLAEKGILFLLRTELPERFRFSRWLFIQGNFPPHGGLSRPFVAVVGSRNPRGPYFRTIRNLLAPLRELGPIVVSGLAPGIDQAAHMTAAEYGLPAIAVLGYGIEQRDPSRRTAAVRSRILESGGAVLSQFMPRARPSARRFLSRNYAIARLSDLVVPVQGRVPSGTYSTVVKAAKLKKPILVPSSRYAEEIAAFLKDQKYQNLHTSPEEEIGNAAVEILRKISNQDHPGSP